MNILDFYLTPGDILEIEGEEYVFVEVAPDGRIAFRPLRAPVAAAASFWASYPPAFGH